MYGQIAPAEKLESGSIYSADLCKPFLKHFLYFIGLIAGYPRSHVVTLPKHTSECVVTYPGFLGVQLWSGRVLHFILRNLRHKNRLT